MKGKVKYKSRRISLKRKQTHHNKSCHLIISNPIIKHPIFNKMKIPKSQMKKVMKLMKKMTNNICKNSNSSWWKIKNLNNKPLSLMLTKTHFDLCILTLILFFNPTLFLCYSFYSLYPIKSCSQSLLIFFKWKLSIFIKSKLWMFIKWKQNQSKI